MALVVAGTARSPSLSRAQFLQVPVEGHVASRAHDISLGRVLGAQRSHDMSLGRALVGALSCLLGSRRVYRRGCLARPVFGLDAINMQEAMYKSIVIELPDGKDHVIDVRDRDTIATVKTILNLELTIDQRTMELETMDGVKMEDDDPMMNFEVQVGSKFRLKLVELPEGAKPVGEEEGLPVVISTGAAGKTSKIRFLLEEDMLLNDVKQMAWEKLKTQVPYVGDLGPRHYGLFIGKGSLIDKHSGDSRCWNRDERLWEYTTVGENEIQPEAIITFANLFFYNGPLRQAKIDALTSKE